MVQKLRNLLNQKVLTIVGLCNIQVEVVPKPVPAPEREKVKVPKEPKEKERPKETEPKDKPKEPEMKHKPKKPEGKIAKLAKQHYKDNVTKFGAPPPSKFEYFPCSWKPRFLLSLLQIKLLSKNQLHKRSQFPRILRKQIWNSRRKKNGD